MCNLYDRSRGIDSPSYVNAKLRLDGCEVSHTCTHAQIGAPWWMLHAGSQGTVNGLHWQGHEELLMPYRAKGVST